MHKATRVFLVLLRIAIGWHFLYEGIWKIESDGAGRQYLTSRYFLQASTGRLRDFFGAAQPGTLTIPAADSRIDKWNDDIVAHFKGQNNALTVPQQKDLTAVAQELKDRAREALRTGENYDAVVAMDWTNIHEQVLKITAKPDEHFTALEYLQGSTGPFRGVFRAMVPDVTGVERLTKASAQASIDEHYEALVSHYKTFSTEQKTALAKTRDELKKSIAETLGDPMFQARLADYKYGLKELREYERGADQPFAKERLDAYRTRLDTIAAELLAFVNEPMVELTRQAQTVATADQLNEGPAPRPRGQTWFIDWAVKWGLVAMGLGLILGLFSQVAAAAAALQLAMFYFAAPPLPGLPAATMGGHFNYIDRNLIEMIAALLLVTVPSGKWAGLDAWLDLWVYPRLCRKQPAPVEAPVAVSA
jgi:uncharacterized membrane protein YphA (DoxX/SURF4 family)